MLGKILRKRDQEDNIMAYFMGKEGFVWWQGVVEDRHDPLYLGRCKVRILGWHSEDKTDMPTVSLPWAYPVAPITSASQTAVGSSPLGPVEGTWVVGFYRDGDAGQEPMFFGTLGGIPELDAKGVNSDGTGIGGKGFFDPRIEGGDVGHPLFEDEKGARDLLYNPSGDLVPREPATIVHDSNPDPAQDAQTVEISSDVTLKDQPNVRSLIAGENSKQFTVKLVENPVRSTYPDTGLGNTAISVTRRLNYLKEPTTNRLARGIRGNTNTSDPRVSGIVYEKMENRKAGQMEIPTASGANWNEPKVPWQAIYPYNHVHQTESGHIIEMDDTPNWERLHWYHRTGTFTEIHPTGIKVDKIINNYYNIILGSRYTHIESNDFTTIDGSQENYVVSNRVDKIGGDYSISVGKGRFNVTNTTGDINLESANMKLLATETFTIDANVVNINKKSSESTEKITGNETKIVGGKSIHRAGAYSLNTQGAAGIQSGGGISLNATDSINESIFGVLPAVTLGYAKKTSATLGKIGMECTDNLLTGGIDFNLGLEGLGASIKLKPLGDIEISSVLGITGITGSTLLGNIEFTSLLSTMKLELTGAAELSGLLSSLKLGEAGDATLAGLLATLKLETSGAAQLSGILSTLKLESSGAALMQGLLGECSVGASGKVKIKGLVATLKEILDEFVDIFSNHMHPTGTGPSGPPMPPAAVQASLLKAIKIGLSLE